MTREEKIIKLFTVYNDEELDAEVDKMSEAESKRLLKIVIKANRRTPIKESPEK